MTRRNRSQMTLEAFEAEQSSLGDHAGEAPATDTAAPEPRPLADDTTSAIVPHGIDEDTIPAVAPRGALDLLRQMEAAA